MTTEPTQPTTEPFAPVPPEPGPFEVPQQPVAPARVKARRGTGWINVALGLAFAVAIGGVAFAAGRMTAPATAAGAGNGGFGRNFGGGGYFGGGYFGAPGDGQARGLFGGGGATIQGTVTAVSPTSITIQTAGGQSITVPLDSATTYHQQSTASSSDVKTGGSVIVRLGLRGQNAGSGGQTTPAAGDITIVP
jgi:hypothetical protein